MSALHLRPARIALAIFITTFIFYALIGSQDEDVEYSSPVSNVISSLHVPSPSFRIPLLGIARQHQIYNPSQKSASSPPLRASSTDRIDPKAHRLPDADAFFPHFDAVLQLPDMTMAEAKAGCTWDGSERIALQFQPDDGWVNASWIENETSNDEISYHRTLWHEFIRRELAPYEDYKDQFSGRGIVIVGGNGKTIQRVKVMIRQLKRLGSKMAIEIHYWENEVSPQQKQELMKLWPAMYFNDLSAEHNIAATGFSIFRINYQMKTAAVVNSRFAEPMLLDSDNIPLIRPEELYESKQYKEYGTVFWPDIARTRANNPAWAITNNVCRMDEWEQESGQMLVDKTRFFYHLQLGAWWSNKHGSYWDNILLGDKDMFRFAWLALQTKYGMPRNFVTSVGMESPLADGSGKNFYCGHHYAQYHPDDDRIVFLHGGMFKAQSPEVLSWARAERNGTFQVYKRMPHDDDPAANVPIYLQWDDGAYLPDAYQPPEHTGMCAEFEGVETRPLDELLPGFEETFEEIGGYWMLDDEGFRDQSN